MFLPDAAVEAEPLLRDHRPITLFELLRGPKHTLLLFPGAYHEAKSWHHLANLAQSIPAGAGDLMNTYLVATDAESVPSN